MRSWIYLLLAIGAEVIGTTSMKLAATHAPVAGMLLMYGMIGLSYFFLALAVKRVPSESPTPFGKALASS